MRRTLTLGATAACVLAAGGTVAAAAMPADDGDRDLRGRLHVLQVTRQDVENRFLDLDHSGSGSDSVGDINAFSADFYVGDAKVGIDGGTCTLVRRPAIYHCVATNAFGEGQLTVMTLADFSQTAPGHFAITGGTGAYRGARGEVTYVDNPDPQRDDVTFRFTTG
jgi:allene oxide cyclase-like protein